MRQEVGNDTNSWIQVIESVDTSQSHHWTETSRPNSRHTKQTGQTWETHYSLAFPPSKVSPEVSMVLVCLLQQKTQEKNISFQTFQGHGLTFYFQGHAGRAPNVIFGKHRRPLHLFDCP